MTPQPKIDWLDWLLGDQMVTQSNFTDPFLTEINLPEGPYPALVTIIVTETSRMRWPIPSKTYSIRFQFGDIGLPSHRDQENEKDIFIQVAYIPTDNVQEGLRRVVERIEHARAAHGNPSLLNKLIKVDGV